MNHIYRIVWNTALDAWVAVQETAKAHGKSGRSGGIATDKAGARFAYTAMASALLLASGQAMAATGAEGGAMAEGNYCYYDTDSQSVVCGDATTSVVDTLPVPPAGSKPAKSVALGVNAKTTGESNVALGSNSSASHTSGLAIGASAKAHNNQTVAIGERASAIGEADVAIGKAAAENTASTGRNVAIGENALSSATKANNMIAIGTNASSGSDATHTVAIGTNANAQIIDTTTPANNRPSVKSSNNVAVGYNSRAGNNNAAEGGAVAIGYTTTASMLQSTALGSAANAGGQYSLAAGANATASANYATAIGGGLTSANAAAASNAFATAVGYNAKSAGRNATALGSTTSAGGLGSTALGSGATTTSSGAIAIGATTSNDAIQRTTASGGNAIAMGVSTTASGLRTVAMGFEAVASQNDGVSIGSEAGKGAINQIEAGNLATTNNIAIGQKAGQNLTASNTVAIGTEAGSGLTASGNAGDKAWAVNNVAIGYHANSSANGGAVQANHTTAVGERSRASKNDATALGSNSNASGFSGTALGAYTTASGDNSIAVGRYSKAEAANAIAIGLNANYNADTGATKTTGERSIAVGQNVQAGSRDTVAMGTSATIDDKSLNSIVIGNQAKAVAGAGVEKTDDSVVIGHKAQTNNMRNTTIGAEATTTKKDQATAVGYKTQALGAKSTALGSNASVAEDAAVGIAIGGDAGVTGHSGIAIGNQAKANAKDAIAIGTGNIVNGVASGALGDPSIVSGTGSYTFGNDNAVGSTSSNAFVLGNNNQIGATATYDAAGKLQLTSGLTNTAAVNGAASVGNRNYITTSGTYVLGSGINTTGTATPLGNTVANSVYLGDDSTVTATAGANALKDSTTTGGTTTGGAVGEVNTATVGSVTYSGFAGKDSVGAVSVGAAGAERRIQNVAAGQISDTSTDAINGSQLFRVANGLQNQISNTATHYYSVNDTGAPRVNPDPTNKTNLGATGTGALAAGMNASAGGTEAVAVGGSANARGARSVAMGNSAKTTDGGTNIGIEAVAIGNGATASNNQAVAVGNATAASGTQAVALGDQAQATGEYSQATGLKAKALGLNAIALGTQAEAGSATLLPEDGGYAVAIGVEAKAPKKGSVALGNKAEATGTTATALGYYSNVSGNHGTAVGNQAKAQANFATALGTLANATAVNSVALGSNSLADRAALASATVGASPTASAAANQVYAPAGVSTAEITGTVKGTLGAVSVGNATSTRQITNVAAGSDNTDAVNVAQLKAVAALSETTPLVVADGTTPAGVPAGQVVAPTTANENKLATAGDIANAINNSGFTLTAQGANGTLVNAGETVNLKNSDGNIKIHKTDTSNDVTFDLEPVVTIGPSTGNPITINGNTGKISGLIATLPATTNGTPGGTPVGNTPSQTAPANPDTVAGNAATVGDILNSGWNVQTNGAATDFVRAYDTVNFADGTGTTVVSETDGTKTTFKVNVNAQGLAESAQLPVVYTKADGTGARVYKHTDGNFYDAPGGGGSLVGAGDVIASMQNAGSSTTTATRLANVAPGTANTDAVNVSQLVGAANALGGGAGVNPDGSFKAPSYTITKTDGTNYPTANNVGDALANLNAEVMNPITFAGDSGAASQRKLGQTLTIKGGETDATKLSSGNNIGVVSNGTDTLTVQLAKNIDLGNDGSVKTGDTTVNNAGVTIVNPADPAKTVSLTGSGLNNGGNKITNVQAGTAPTDAVNRSQLDAVSAVASKGWDIGNGTSTVGTVAPGKQVDFVSGNTSNTKVEVTQDAATGNSTVKVSAAPAALQYTGTNTPAGGNTPNADQFTPTNQVTLVGVGGDTSNGVTINNVAPAVLSDTSKQAVNGSQLYAVGNSTAAALGGTSAFDPATGKVTAGLSVGGATHNSVQDALNAINTTAGSGWNLQANGGTPSNIAPNGTVNVVDGSNTTVALSGNELKVNVVDNPTFSGTVTANGGLTVGGNLTAQPGTTVDMGNNRIQNVADGSAPTDAVNVRQLQSVTGNITNITNQINAVDARVTNVDNRVTQLGDRVTNVDARVTNVDNRVTQLGDQVTNIGGQVTNIGGQVTALSDLVGTNPTNPDGTRGSTTYDVEKQTTTTHSNLFDTVNKMNLEGIKYTHTKDNGEAPVLANAETNDSSAGADGSTAHGVNAIVDPGASNGTAMGRRSHVRAPHGIAIGNESEAGGESALAVGDGARALGKRSISIGTGNTVYGEGSGAIGDPSIIHADNAYSIGNNNQIAAGSNEAFVLGNEVTATAANSVNLGSRSAAQTAATPQTAGTTDYSVGIVNGVAQNYAGGAPVGVVSVGDVGQERRVQNVAAGLVSPTSTDAINGSQLYQTASAINSLSNRINVNHDKAMGGVASAMASAGLPQAYLPGKSMVAMGAATYQGRTALALGVSTISDNGRWVMKGSLNTNNHGTVGANVGVGYQW